MVNLGDWDQLRATLSDLDALIEPDRRPQPAPRQETRVSEPEPYQPVAPYHPSGDVHEPPYQNGTAHLNGGAVTPDFILPPSPGEAAQFHGMSTHNLSNETFPSRYSPFQNQEMGEHPLNELNAEPPVSPATEMYLEPTDNRRRVSAISDQSNVRSPPAAYARSRYEVYHDDDRGRQEY
jgi:hypothetical protein